MKNAKVFLVILCWSLLIGPALHVGHVLQTHLMPSPAVTAEFDDGTSMRARFLVEVDGSEWLVADDGQRRALKSVVSLQAVPTEDQASTAPSLWGTWLGVGPLIALSCVMLWVFLRLQRS